jgi:hypothetical protein
MAHLEFYSTGKHSAAEKVTDIAIFLSSTLMIAYLAYLPASQLPSRLAEGLGAGVAALLLLAALFLVPRAGVAGRSIGFRAKLMLSILLSILMMVII